MSRAEPPSAARALLLLVTLPLAAAVDVSVDRSARRLLVNGQPFFARGLRYSPVPVGERRGDFLGATTLERITWEQDLSLMEAMGVNSISIAGLAASQDHSPFLDACWARGIVVAISLEWPFGLSAVDASIREGWMAQALELVRRYKGHPAVLLWAIGSESSGGSDTDEERRLHLAFVTELREAFHSEERNIHTWHPVCASLTDVHAAEYFSLEPEYPEAVDAWCLQLEGGDVGPRAVSIFRAYRNTLPLLVTEYGADAWDGVNRREWAAGPSDEQRDALLASSRRLREWRSVVSGGMVQGFVDEWWRCPSGREDQHEPCAGAAGTDLPDGESNEEWRGLFATELGPRPQARTPRAAVAALTELWRETSFGSAVRLAPEADTYVGMWEAVSEHGGLEYFSTKYHSWDAGSGTAGQSQWNEVGLLRFPAEHAPSCSSPRARVEVTVRWLSAEPMVLAYGPLTDLTWDEAEVSRKSLALTQDTRRTVTLTNSDINTRVSLDVDDWWSLGLPFGLWLQPDDTIAANSDQQIGFYSRESQFGPPELAVECSHSWADEGWYGFAATTTAAALATTASRTTTTAASTSFTATPFASTSTSAQVSSTTPGAGSNGTKIVPTTATTTAGAGGSPRTSGAPDAGSTSGAEWPPTPAPAAAWGENSTTLPQGGGSSTTTTTSISTTSSRTTLTTSSSTSSISTTTSGTTTTSTRTLSFSGVEVDRGARRLLLDGQRFFAQGLSYSPVPVGQQGPADWLGSSPEEREVWEGDLDLIAAMGANTLRVSNLSSAKDHTPFLNTCQAKGIMVAFALDWPSGSSPADDPAGRDAWIAEVLQLVRKYAGHPAVLLWALQGAEGFGSTNADDRRRRHLTFAGQLRDAIHREELPSGRWHPVCTTVAEIHAVEYFAMEAEFPAAVDLWCLRLHGGAADSHQSLYSSYDGKLPLLVAEYGVDAWDGANGREWAAAGPGDKQRGALVAAARELREWRSLVTGGVALSFVDEWWRCGTGSPSEHDTCVGGGGANEEWMGVYATALGPIPQVRTPRPAAAALAGIWQQTSFESASLVAPEADTFVGRWEATSRHGNLEHFSTKYHSWTPGSGTIGQSEWNEVGILRFPALSQPSCLRPRAKLELTVSWLTTEPMVIAYGPLADLAWSESAVSWADLALDRETRRTATLTKANVSKKVSLDLDGWWSGIGPFGLWVQPDDTVAANSDQQAGFYSRESSFGPPQLVATCEHSWAEEGWHGFGVTSTSTTTASTPAAATTTASSGESSRMPSGPGWNATAQGTTTTSLALGANDSTSTTTAAFAALGNASTTGDWTTTGSTTTATTATDTSTSTSSVTATTTTTLRMKGVEVDRSSRRLLVDGRRFFAQGVCYSPVPAGQSAADWLGPTEIERGIWERDLDLMVSMGVNALRVYDISLAKDHTAFLDACWERGIMVTVTLDWPRALSLTDASGKDYWIWEVLQHVRKYKGHPAVLVWGIGNEKNHASDTDEARRQHLTFVQEVREAIHSEELRTGHWHPVCTALMDLHLTEYFALEADYPRAVDLWCLQLYRGASFRSSLFATYPSSLPLLITEYGADAWDGSNRREWSAGSSDEQRNALVSKSAELRDWRSVVAGGMIFSFVDEWWKCGGGGPDTHDLCSVGSFGGLSDEEANEEWWGLYATALGPYPQARTPRPVVQALTELWHEADFVATTRLLPEADTYIGKWEAVSNHGRLDYLSTKYHSWVPGSGPAGQSEWNEVGILRFPAVPPASCRGPRAAVEVFVRWLSMDQMVLAYGPLESTAWPEQGLRWRTLGLGQQVRRTVTITKADIFNKVTLDVEGWWSLGRPFAIWLQPDDRVPENSDGQAGFYSRESHFGPPELAVTCHHSWVEEGWYGFKGAEPTTPPDDDANATEDNASSVNASAPNATTSYFAWNITRNTTTATTTSTHPGGDTDQDPATSSMPSTRAVSTTTGSLLRGTTTLPAGSATTTTTSTASSTEPCCWWCWWCN